MKIYTFILSFCGFCALYICNADWIDELIEDYLGGDYEEIGPFISSVTAGTEEFDQIVEEFRLSKSRWWLSPTFVVIPVLCCLTLPVLLYHRLLHTLRAPEIVKTFLEFLCIFKKSTAEKEEIQTIVTEFLETKLKQFCKNKEQDDVPVKLLWKGGTLVESSIHCSIKDESKFQHVHLLQSKLLFDPLSRKGKQIIVAPSSSETSTAKKMAEIRRMLESQQELGQPAIEGVEAQGLRQVPPPGSHDSEEKEDAKPRQKDRPCDRNLENGTDQDQKEEAETKLDSEGDSTPDPKLMNRIRLLENRLRIEELKNKNWINRMSKAEGILQQLNKQVERIESRPMGTLTETLKITSTTNWAPLPQPRRNMRFTLVNQYPLFCMRPPYSKLSELIQKEIGFPSSGNYNKNLLQLPPIPQIAALTSPSTMPQSSFLSKFLCR